MKAMDLNGFYQTFISFLIWGAFSNFPEVFAVRVANSQQNQPKKGKEIPSW